MSSEIGQRLLVLAGATLLALVVALAVLELREDSDEPDAPGSVAAPGVGWYTAFAGPYAPTRGERVTECGYRRRVAGVSHPVLPCRTQVVLRLGGKLVVTQVVDRDPGARNREFGITRPLARRLGLRRVTEIRWRFAAA